MRGLLYAVPFLRHPLLQHLYQISLNWSLFCRIPFDFTNTNMALFQSRHALRHMILILTQISADLNAICEMSITMLQYPVAEYNSRIYMLLRFASSMSKIMGAHNSKHTMTGPASDSFYSMVTMLVPRTEKIPLSTDFGGENTPYFNQNEDFCCMENHPFFRFQGEHSDFKDSTAHDNPF